MGKREAGSRVTLSVMGQNPSDRHCKKGDVVNMTDDRTKNERL